LCSVLTKLADFRSRVVVMILPRKGRPKAVVTAAWLLLLSAGGSTDDGGRAAGGVVVVDAFVFRGPVSRRAKPRRPRSEEGSYPSFGKPSAADDHVDHRRGSSSAEGSKRRAFATAATAFAILAAAASSSSSPAMAAAAVGDAIGLPEYLSVTERDVEIRANRKLVDYAVGTVNTQFYDSSGGARFNPSDFYLQWKDVRKAAEENGSASSSSSPGGGVGNGGGAVGADLRLDTRDGTVETLRYLVSTLKDPYSRYMTREELRYELKGTHHGFLGTGAYIEVPRSAADAKGSPPLRTSVSTDDRGGSIDPELGPPKRSSSSSEAATAATTRKKPRRRQLLTNTMVENLPVVTAVAPNSPAERAGLVVGDRIVGVGDKDNFLGYGRDEIRGCLSRRWGYSETHQQRQPPVEYFGVADLTIAKPVYSFSPQPPVAVAVTADGLRSDDEPSSAVVVGNNREIVLGYRSTKAKLPTIATSSGVGSGNLRGDAAVQYELLLSSSSEGGVGGTLERAIPGSSSSSSNGFGTKRENDDDGDGGGNVGYIRLTRFSKSSTEGYLRAVRDLEKEGADSYVIDLRNNYGGVIQEAMLTASTLLGDPHAILCYLLNARGGFTPVDVESWVVDPRYPGYLLTREDEMSVLEQVMREHPSMFRISSDGRLVASWDPPSSYASIHEQVSKRGIHPITYAAYDDDGNIGGKSNGDPLRYRERTLRRKMLQKDVVVLINEGTASSSEFFVAALRDNGRVDVVGTKSFGKGIIQHTFPMPDGGGLKLTIGEFLRPSLRHVTNAFGVGYVDKASGEIVGNGLGGVDPDVTCESAQGIPGNPRSDLCVKVAMDVLEEKRYYSASSSSSFARAAPVTTTANAVVAASSAAAESSPASSSSPKALSSRF